MGKKLKVAIVYTGEASSGRYPEDSAGRDDGDPRDDPLKLIVRALKKKGCSARLVDLTFEKLCRLDADVAFNLCDCGLGNDSSTEPHIPAMLELKGIKYTGSGPLALSICMDKALTKEILASNGLPTPKFCIAESAARLKHNLRYPLIVKPLREDGSIGIKEDAVVKNAAELKKRVSRVKRLYHQPAIVEEFLDGREFTVSLIGNEDPAALPICEIKFMDGKKIVSYDAKWARGSERYLSTSWECPADISKKLETQIIDLSKRAYKLLGLRGYGRIDIRMDGKTPNILEVNPNPDLSLDAQTYRSAVAAGMPYGKLIRKIFDCALK